MAPKLIKFLFFTSFLEPVKGSGLFVPLPIGQASRESNLPKAKNYLSLTIGRDFFLALAFSFSSVTPTEQTYCQTEKKRLSLLPMGFTSLISLCSANLTSLSRVITSLLKPVDSMYRDVGNL